MKISTAVIIASENSESTKVMQVFRDLGYEAFLSRDKESYMDWIHQESCAFCIFDSALANTQEASGFALFRECLETKHVPLIYLTHRDTPAQLWKDVGAEIYLQSPIDSAKVKTQISAYLAYIDSHPIKKTDLSAQSLFHVDEQRRWLWYGDKAIPMTPTELKIMQKLISQPKHVLGRQEIAMSIWTDDDPNKYRRIDVNLRRIRKRCEDLGIDLPVTTVRGQGYAYML